jgi:toxin CptA
MPHSQAWSSGSAHCRSRTEAAGAGLQWRPSRWLVAAQCVLGALGAVSLLASALPPPAGRALAVLACGWGMASAWRLARQEARLLHWPADGARPTLDGEPMAEARLHWRGPLAFLRWRDRGGCVRHLSWWPDTLPPGARRELRLVSGERRRPAGRRSVAG